MLVNMGLDIISYTNIIEPQNIRGRGKNKKTKNTIINKRKEKLN